MNTGSRQEKLERNMGRVKMDSLRTSFPKMAPYECIISSHMNGVMILLNNLPLLDILSVSSSTLLNIFFMNLYYCHSSTGFLKYNHCIEGCEPSLQYSLIILAGSLYPSIFCYLISTFRDQFKLVTSQKLLHILKGTTHRPSPVLCPPT